MKFELVILQQFRSIRVLAFGEDSSVSSVLALGMVRDERSKYKRVLCSLSSPLPLGLVPNDVNVLLRFMNSNMAAA